MQELITVLKALSDETRIRIMRVLLERECCVCEIMQALDISQTRASRNLGILQKAGFLKTRRDGPWILYAIGREIPNEYAKALTRLLKTSAIRSEVLEQDKDRLKRAQRTDHSDQAK